MLSNDEDDEAERNKLINSGETRQGTNGSGSSSLEQMQIQTNFEN